MCFQFDKEGRLQIDFDSTLSTTQPKVTLDGDQHAGFQFRASNEVAESNAKQTFYIRPKDGKDEMGKTKKLASEQRHDQFEMESTKCSSRWKSLFHPLP